MFREAALKLALLYLAIIMAISLFFSINVYQLSIQELNRGLKIDPIIESIPNHKVVLPLALERIRQEQQLQYDRAKDHIVQRLFLINLFILVGGGFLSYYLALRTLRPIEEANEAQSRFTADASHELRTPIAAMRSEIEVALMNPRLTLKEAKEKLRSNLEELEQLTNLSDGLLKLAQLEHNDLQLVPVAVATVVQHALNRVMPLAEQRSILIASSVPEDITVQAEEASLTEALVILLDNAVKYSPDKSEIKVEVARSSRSVTITVTDHGIGIKASDLPHIFDRFYRADTARSKQRAHGYGIGLAIAKNIVELHGGKLTAQSKPGRGSSFTIALPLPPRSA